MLDFRESAPSPRAWGPALGIVALVFVLVPLLTERRTPDEWRESLVEADPFERRMTALALREATPPRIPRAVAGLAILLRDRDDDVRRASEASLAHLAHRVAARAEAGDAAARAAYPRFRELGLPGVDAALGHGSAADELNGKPEDRR